MDYCPRSGGGVVYYQTATKGEVMDLMELPTKAKCPECGRVFDLADEDDAGEFYYGHDCEVPENEPEPPIVLFDNLACDCGDYDNCTECGAYRDEIVAWCERAGLDPKRWL